MITKILDIMNESHSDLLKSEASNAVKWSKLKHNKDDFELFLQFNLAEIEFKTVKNNFKKIVCTGNTALIKILKTSKPEAKQKLIKYKGPALKSKDKNSVLVWDIKDSSYKTIKLDAWQINQFISINPENILILDEILKNI